MKLFESTIFSNRAARQSFIFLLVGFILLCAAALSVFNMYLQYGRHPISEERLTRDAIRAVLIARSLPVDKLPLIRILNVRGIYLSMSPQPNPKAQIIPLPTSTAIRNYIRENSYNFRISVQLANGQWLNVHGFRPHSFWISIGALILGAVLFFALIFVCIWPIKRLAWPWDTMTKAVRRFGVDVDAPPLAESGPRELQIVIRAFNEMQSRIRRLMRDRTQMLAAISHDLRTPITRLQLRAEYLEGTPQYEKTIADLNEMERMISSILAFAREQNTTETMERFDLNALLEALCHDMQDVGQPVTYRNKRGERMLFFGRIMGLKRAFVNLIENAVKYGNKAQVLLKMSEHNNEVQLIIEDEGPGIPEEEMENVFAPFYRVDSSRSLKLSGTGLGLAVARDIVRAHGGDIKLYNRERKGLRVVVSLPLRVGN